LRKRGSNGPCDRGKQAKKKKREKTVTPEDAKGKGGTSAISQVPNGKERQWSRRSSEWATYAKRIVARGERL